MLLYFVFFGNLEKLGAYSSKFWGSHPPAAQPISCEISWASSFPTLVVSQLSFQVKVGVMYCRAGQSTEEEMYNNETAGPALEEFLDLLGEKVRLKGFTKYRAQLDTKSNHLQHPSRPLRLSTSGSVLVNGDARL